MRCRSGIPVLALVLALVLTACGSDDDSDGPAEAAPSPSVRTLTPLPMPPPAPPSGKLLAALEMSSRDAALGRFQVWVDNDTTDAITPNRVTYHDGRFRRPLPGTRLRDIPAQSRRGFPIYYPERPACDGPADRGELRVEYTASGERRTATVPVQDEADVVDRIASARCLELAVAEIARLSWADEVTADGDGAEGSVGTITLVVEPTGRAGPTLVIDSISGNPVLSPGEGGAYNPNVTITGDQAPQRVAVPIRPTRCDGHAFGESGSFAAFTLNVRVEGEVGQLVLRLGPQGAAAAVAYAQASCGLLTGIGSDAD